MSGNGTFALTKKQCMKKLPGVIPERIDYIFEAYGMMPSIKEFILKLQKKKIIDDIYFKLIETRNTTPSKIINARDAYVVSCFELKETRKTTPSESESQPEPCPQPEALYPEPEPEPAYVVSRSRFLPKLNVLMYCWEKIFNSSDSLFESIIASCKYGWNEKKLIDVCKKIKEWKVFLKFLIKRSKMLQDIYKAIADMNLQYGDGEVVKPTNEAELVTAIEFLKTNDSTEMKNSKDLYDATKKSELPGAEGVNDYDNKIEASVRQILDDPAYDSEALLRTLQDQLDWENVEWINVIKEVYDDCTCCHYSDFIEMVNFEDELETIISTAYGNLHVAILPGMLLSSILFGLYVFEMSYDDDYPTLPAPLVMMLVAWLFPYFIIYWYYSQYRRFEIWNIVEKACGKKFAESFSYFLLQSYLKYMIPSWFRCNQVRNPNSEFEELKCNLPWFMPHICHQHEPTLPRQDVPSPVTAEEGASDVEMTQSMNPMNDR